MPRLSRKLRHQVITAAQNRCEYCQTLQEMTMASFHLDHIIPRSKNGKTEFANLCLSCPFCNQFKSEQVFARDPKTGRQAKLFHPRQDQWHKHFRWSKNGLEIIGITARGRATVIALNLNHPLALRARNFWVANGIHPPD